MSHQRGHSGSLSTPHAISLKVLRLSRPSLTSQTPLPTTSNFANSNINIPSTASRAYPSADQESSFPFTPLLTLPTTFGAAYVGEVFTCTLCANNELPAAVDGEAGARRSVSGVKIAAELQTPSQQQQGIALELEGGEEEDDDGSAKEGSDIPPGGTIQRTLRHDLKDEGPHVLVVTVTYYETQHSAEGEASGGRVRTFRKLYQFVSQQLIAVRSKVTERKLRNKGSAREWILEAQLENVGEASVVLEDVLVMEREGIGSLAVNGDEGEKEAIVLKPSDVEQVMFLLKQEGKAEEGVARIPLAQLKVLWRNAMGERGTLVTGWLASRGR